jgi:chromosome segregation ATPase
MMGDAYEAMEMSDPKRYEKRERDTDKREIEQLRASLEEALKELAAVTTTLERQRMKLPGRLESERDEARENYAQVMDILRDKDIELFAAKTDLEEAQRQANGERHRNNALVEKIDSLQDALAEAQAKITAAREWISKRQGPANHSMSDLLAILEGTGE